MERGVKASPRGDLFTYGTLLVVVSAFVLHERNFPSRDKVTLVTFEELILVVGIDMKLEAVPRVCSVIAETARERLLP